ncbi:NAD-dependent epimerase/dehydratase family protein [Pseudoxanthomonas sp. CF125]|uniref:NAD-dependent epimerase/dehydratase family protein n=1 Tax=Pseudoxanthomonas sp. CF125 TaxID=1855303 RepID=UPI00088E863B|nr:NAD-dependent epimerase/dehydratase family protein [Pseudoxanthomonas sp. CF125]SDR22065.1 NAD dependent epimerase/dehydratase family protein [Pseudoxanthomonas sp. CF125]
MRIILLGASGMVGQGVLIECLRDRRVEHVLSLGRTASGRQDAKLQELVHADLYDLSAVEDRLRGYDACFYCLGVSSVGMAEAEYKRITYDMTLAVADVLARLNPGMTFIYVSGANTDSSEQGRSMWARIKGRTENALLRLPFKAVYLFRPGGIQPLHGVRPKVGWIRAIYAATAPLLSLAVRYAPGGMTTSERVGLAMINATARGGPSRVLESRDINSEAQPD